MDIELNPRKVAQILSAIAFGFVLAQIAVQLAEIYLGLAYDLSLFDLDGRQSIPRFYSAIMLLLCAALLITISLAKKKYQLRSCYHWLGLSIIFLFLAIAKITSIHDVLALAVQTSLKLSKIQFYTWTYGILTVIIPLVYLRFLLSLPRRTMLLFALSGITFLLGAFGLDLVVAFVGQSVDHHTVAYIGLDVLEEVVEMCGIILFIYTILSFMKSEMKSIRVKIISQ